MLFQPNSPDYSQFMNTVLRDEKRSLAPVAEEVLKPFLSHDSGIHRTKCGWMMINLDPDNALPFVEKLLDDENPETRKNAEAMKKRLDRLNAEKGARR